MSLRPAQRLISSIFVALSLSIVVVLPAAAATASSSTNPNGLKVSPVTTNLVIEPGSTRTVTISVQNVTKAAINLQAIVNDFTASASESGIPALLLNGQYAPTHSLKRFVSPIDNFSLGPNEQKNVNVTVTVPKNTSGGGYYGAIRFTPAALTNGGSNVSLSASVGSLILVRVPGNVKEQLLLSSFDIRSSGDDAPRVFFTTNQHLEAVARFQNTGDVQEQPFGKVTVMQGSKPIASYEINNTEPRGNVLPDSTRKFTVSLDKIGIFGKYTIKGNFGYGTSGQLVSGETTFYVIPLALLVAAIIAILIVLFCIFVVPKMIRNYNRRVVERATRR